MVATSGKRNPTSAPKRGDIVWTDLNPIRGHEQAGRRPVVVVSAEYFNKRTGLAFVVPITSKRRGYEIEVPIETRHVQGAALTSNMRAIDWKTRGIAFVEHCPTSALRAIQGMLVAFITREE